MAFPTAILSRAWVVPMQVEYINPFIKSLANVFETMLDCKPSLGEISLNHERVPKHSVSGVIGLSGKAKGTVVLSLSEEVALKAASTLLMIEATELDEEVIDAVGELTNMLAGGAKAELEQYELSVSLPNVVLGQDHDICFPPGVTPIHIPFETAWGSLSVEVALAEV